jgi:hypothetical protein
VNSGNNTLLEVNGTQYLLELNELIAAVKDFDHKRARRRDTTDD